MARLKAYIVLITCITLITTSYADSNTHKAVNTSNQIISYEPETCSRIVSLSPSITEMLFELGLGANIVGVTRYDKYPEQVNKIPKIGGFLDLNIESVVSLRPTLILSLVESKEYLKSIQDISINSQKPLLAYVDHRNIVGILSSISVVSKLCNVQKLGEIKRKMLKEELSNIFSSVKYKEKLSVLISLGSENNSDNSLKNIFISGNDGFYTELLKYANATNAYTGKTSALGNVTIEGIIAINPQVIIEILPEALDSVTNINPNEALSDATRLQSWDEIKYVEAVKNKRIYTIRDDAALIPSMRMINLLKKFIDILNKIRDPQKENDNTL